MASYQENMKIFELIKRTMLDMIADLQQIFNQSTEEEDDMIKVNIFFKDMHPETAYKHIRDHILPHRQKIQKRDIIFFLENKGLFSGLPENKVKYYSRQITSKTRLAEEDKTAIWEYLEVIVLYTDRVK